MTIDDVALRVAAALNRAGVPYILVGGFSSNYYGIPRSTKDADFVVQLNAPLSSALAATLGSDFERNRRCPSKQTLEPNARNFV